MKVRFAWIALVVCCGLVGGTAVASAENREDFCAEMYTKKYYPGAAKCYAKLGKAIRFSPSMKESLRLRKGMLLREAARNWKLAAQEQNKIEVAAFMREQASRLLAIIVKQKLVRKKYGKRRARVAKAMLADTKKKVGYATLSISTSRLDARIEIVGYEFSHRTTNKFSQQVRPGPYKIKVFYQGQKLPRRRNVVVAPGISRIVAFLPNPGLPVASWVGYTVGGAALIIGGVIFTIGATRTIDANNCASSGSCFIYPKLNPLEAGFVVCWVRSGPLATKECKNRTDRGNKTEGQAYITGESIPLMIAGGSSMVLGAVLISIAVIAHVNSLNDAKKKREKANRDVSMRIPSFPTGARPMWASEQ